MTSDTTIQEGLTNDSDASTASSGVSDISHSCSGCQELGTRVARLEEQVARLSLSTSASAAMLGTTAAYWITIAVHGILLAIMTAGAAGMGTLLYAFLLGAIGTLGTCHVFPVRTVIHKLARTMVSVGVVSLSALIPFISQLNGGVEEIFAGILLYVPPSFFLAWLVAKIFVWTRGWKIVAPNSNGIKPPFKISDMLLVTLIAAVYFSACRVAAGTVDVNWNDDGMISIIAVIAGASILGAVSSSLLARGLLTQGTRIRFRWVFGSFSVLLFTTGSFAAFFIFQNGDFGEWPEMAIYLVYAAASLLLCMLSPVVTFSLMRAAGYQLVVPGSKVHATS